MNIFGKKNADEQLPEDIDDALDGADAAAGFDSGAEGLSAPTRLSAGSGKGRKGLLGGVLVAVLAVAGGAYYMTMPDSAVVAPPAAMDHPVPQAPVAAADSQMPGVPSALPDTAADPLATPADTMPADATAAAAPSAAMPAAPDGMGEEPPLPGEQLAAMPVQPAALDAPVQSPVQSPIEGAAMPSPAVPVDASAEAVPALPDEMDGLGVPPAGDAPVMQVVQEEAPASAQPDMPVPSITSEPAKKDSKQDSTTEVAPIAPQSSTAAAPADIVLPNEQKPVEQKAVEATNNAVPAADLPMPADAPKQADAPAPAGTASAEKGKTAAATPTEAEKALVQNAGVVDAMGGTAPVGSLGGTATAGQSSGTVTGAGTGTDPASASGNPAVDISAETAMVRPLPQQYLIVRKKGEAGDADSRLAAARAALNQGRTSSALQMFNELQTTYPRDSRVLMGRALAMQRLGQVDEALAAYEQVLDNDPKNLEALTNMLGLLKRSNPDLAISKLTELRETYPYNAEITAQLGVAMASKGDFESALKYLDMADAIKPGSAYVLYNRGVLLDKMGRSREAADIYRQIVRMAADGDIDASLPIETIKRRLAVMK